MYVQRTVFCVIFCRSVLSYADEDADILRRLSVLETKQRSSQNALQELRSLVSTQSLLISQQQRDLDRLQTWRSSCNMSCTQQHTQVTPIKRQIGGGIAFTAYLDHSYDLTGGSQHVVFNKVLINDGSGYNPQTGTFVCPEDGVYLITFIVSSRQAQPLACALMVNGQLQLNAVADSYHPGQGIQGTNSLVVRLSAGDSVWVERHGGQHIEGDPSYRYSSFSAIYLYN